MENKIFKWLRHHYLQIINSIAFFPAVIATCFVLLSIVVLEIDFSDFGKNLKARWNWATLKDASTARTIAATIAGGILSLTVFSFSMVMILLNQAASNMSNRVLSSMIENRFQQVVLGFYIGTIVYALFLLSTIRDIDSGIYVPALSVYLLIALTIIDIFLFIYFLHYITQSVKYETIIHKVHKKTKASLKEMCVNKDNLSDFEYKSDGYILKTNNSGVFQGTNTKELIKLCARENFIISFLHPTGTYILKNNPLLMVHRVEEISKEVEEELNTLTYVDIGNEIEWNYYYGFKQLTEVAVKALSPGINDPGTALLSLRSLADLLAFRSHFFPEPVMKDKDGHNRIFFKERSLEEIFATTILPIWDYGKNDRSIQHEIRHLILQLQMQTNEAYPIMNHLLILVNAALQKNNDNYPGVQLLSN